MEIYLASGNKHKQLEMSEILSPHTIIIPKDKGIDFDPIEDGKTFAENSLIKAKALYQIVKVPVIADDSGICVDILGGMPGIFSARYCGKNTYSEEKIDSSKRNELLLQEVEEKIAGYRKQNPSCTKSDEELRACRFVCSMVLYMGNDRFYTIQETLEGRLVKDASECKGTGGFGYDPIVFLTEYGKTVAELSESEKNAISHRGKAGLLLAKLL